MEPEPRALAAAQKLWFISMLTPAREGSLLSSASVPTCALVCVCACVRILGCGRANVQACGGAEGQRGREAGAYTTSTMVEMAPPCSAPAQLAVAGGWLLAMALRQRKAVLWQRARASLAVVVAQLVVHCEVADDLAAADGQAVHPCSL